MLVQLGHHRGHVQAHLREPFLRDLDKHLLVLHAKQLDLGHIGHAQQLLAQAVGLGLDFGGRETLAAQGVNHAEHITKIVIEKRPDHTRRQAAAHVTDLFAHGVPNVRHICRVRVVLDLKNDLRLARLGIAADLVGKRHLLQRALDLVGHLLGHLLGRGPGPISPHHHGAEGEGRVFVLPQLEIRRHAQHHQHHHQVARQGRVLQRPAREVESGVVGTAHSITSGWLQQGPMQQPKQQARALVLMPMLAQRRTPSPSDRATTHAPRHSPPFVRAGVQS